MPISNLVYPHDCISTIRIFVSYIRIISIMKIKTNDNVKVMSGKDAGKSGKVIQVFPTEEKVVVEGVNMMKKAMKTNKKGEKGQIIELSGPLHFSKVALVCSKCNQPTRVGYKMDGGDKKRVCRKCKELID
jgi:large subunit ribosomal protein L24